MLLLRMASRKAFSDDYWSKLYGWYHSGGIGHVAAYLRTLDLSDFNAKAPPQKTPAFWDIVSANSTPEDAELADALDQLGVSAVFSPRERVVGAHRSAMPGDHWRDW